MGNPRTDLFDLLKASDVTFWPLHRQELSRTAGGSTQAKDLGDPLWSVRVTTVPEHFRDAQALEAALISLNGSAGSFLAHDMRRPFPKEYSDGNFADDGRLRAVDAGNLFQIELEALPADFQLRAGDYLGFEYGARPSRALHMITADVKANAGGVAVGVKVWPSVRPGFQVGAAVTFKRPSCEMILDPNQPAPAMSGMVASVVSISAVQIF